MCPNFFLRSVTRFIKFGDLAMVGIVNLISIGLNYHLLWLLNLFFLFFIFGSFFLFWLLFLIWYLYIFVILLLVFSLNRRQIHQTNIKPFIRWVQLLFINLLLVLTSYNFFPKFNITSAYFVNFHASSLCLQNLDICFITKN